MRERRPPLRAIHICHHTAMNLRIRICAGSYSDSERQQASSGQCGGVSVIPRRECLSVKVMVLLTCALLGPYHVSTHVGPRDTRNTLPYHRCSPSIGMPSLWMNPIGSYRRLISLFFFHSRNAAAPPFSSRNRCLSLARPVVYLGPNQAEKLTLTY